MAFHQPQDIINMAREKVRTGELTVSEANVYMVQLQGVRIVRNSMPKAVRSALNLAVKEGRLGHVKKDGLKPEAYFHVNSKFRALEERDRIEREVMSVSNSLQVMHSHLD
jgi:hypothetical protein